ncbi:hypothetical protein [Pectobacterium aroidearum]|uniref:hypothetical protein n=1 Tax=Pectobacterium aroidearum TaxID=1201031 RepID=UPI00331648FB
MLRKMTDLEQKTALLLVEAGECARWEYSASLHCPDGPLLEFRTEKQHNQANPSSELLDSISVHPNFVLHHNHLSGESLSFADWRGASNYFNEIYAHCNDGTSYYGKVLNQEEMLSLINDKKDLIEVMAENHLFKYTNDTKLDAFFRKEVICRALNIRGYVEYGYSWGERRINHQAILTMKIFGIQSIGQLGTACESWIQSAALDLSNDNW